LYSCESRLESIFNALTDGLIVFNNEGVIEDFNPAAEILFGYKKEEAVGENVSLLLPSLPHGSDHQKFLLDCEGKNLDGEREIVCCRQNNSTFHACLSISRFADGEDDSFICTVHNISERIAMEEELKATVLRADKASEAKSEFLANMSHEIRTPLNGVMGMLELLKDTPLNSRQKNFVTTAYDSAGLLLSVISSILDFSKLNSGSLDVENKAFDIRGIFDDSINKSSVDIAGKGLRLNLEISPELPNLLHGDPVHLQQVVHNLISNSVKFTEEGEISLRVSQSDRNSTSAKIHVEVEDTGIGIAESKLDSLFEPFTQEDNSSTRKYGGSGLGLTVARRLIELMGGEIGVKSKEDQGTTFWFSLWFDLDDSDLQEDSQALGGRNLSEQHKEISKSGDRARFQNKSILIVDDISTNLKVGQEMLRKFGLTADLATNGREALSAMKSKDYDLVLMDCQMPVMDGFAAAQEVRKLEKLSEQATHVPIIAVTAHALEGDREASLQAGMDDYLAKPLAIAELETLLNRWL